MRDGTAEHYRRALELYRSIGDPRGEGQALSNMGSALKTLGQTNQAIEHYLRAVAIYREIGDRVGEAQGHNNLGNIYTDVGRFDEGLAAYRTAIATHREMDDEYGAGLALANLGIVYYDLSNFDLALTCYQQAGAAFETVAATADLDWVRSLIANLPAANTTRRKQRLFGRERDQAEASGRTLLIEYCGTE